MKNTNNAEIRNRMRRTGVFWWEIADELNISEATLYRKIRRPLDSETESRIKKAIDSIVAKRG